MAAMVQVGPRPVPLAGGRMFEGSGRKCMAESEPDSNPLPLAGCSTHGKYLIPVVLFLQDSI